MSTLDTKEICPFYETENNRYVSALAKNDFFKKKEQYEFWNFGRTSPLGFIISKSFTLAALTKVISLTLFHFILFFF